MIPIRGSPLPDDEKYESAIFFDNDENKIVNVNDICPKITTIKVPETASRVSEKPFDSPLMTSLIDKAGGDHNIYIHLLKKSGYTSDGFDEISGIDPDIHGPIIKTWIDKRENPNKNIILIDWDRTTTVVEGFIEFPYERFAEYSQLSKGDFYNDYLRYLSFWFNLNISLTHLFGFLCFIHDLKIGSFYDKSGHLYTFNFFIIIYKILLNRMKLKKGISVAIMMLATLITASN